MFKVNTLKFVLSSIAFVVASFVAMYAINKFVFANSCEPTYGGGLECEEGFNLVKEVKRGKIGDESDDYDKSVEGVKKGEIVTFRITIENTGEIDGEDLEMEDNLPEHLDKTFGSLTEDIEVLDNGDSIEFFIEVKVKDSEFEAGVSRCAINEARLKGDLNEDGNKETIDSDTAVVCYGDNVTELPKTGNEDVVIYTLYGLGMIIIGLGIKRFTA